MPDPTPATVKKLFCLSGNRCPYPGCPLTLVDPGSGVVMAEICHIKGEKAGAARYDAGQDDDGRRAFENLILMCGGHHKVIDTAVGAWTVEALIALKKEHEAKATPVPEPADEIVAQLISSVHVNVGSVVGGSVITTIGQTGGQAAHQIFNIGEQRRRLSEAQIADLATRLAPFPVETFWIVAPSTNGEALRFGEYLHRTFKRAGWTSEADGPAESMGAEPLPPGMHVYVASRTPTVDAFADWCRASKIDGTISVGRMAPENKLAAFDIYLGPAIT